MRMSKNLFLVNYENPELRIAEVRNSRLHDLDVERFAGDLGSIYMAAISNVLSGMEATFVDIGQKKNGLLHFRDIHWFPTDQSRSKANVKIENLKVNQPLMVQIARPGVGNKGPRLTTRISLPGRFIVLVFPSESVGVSRKIESEAERHRLRHLIEKIRPFDCGLIVRTEAEGISSEAIENDLQNLLAQLQNLKVLSKTVTPPSCLHKDLGILGKLVRDRLSLDTEAIYIDDETQFQFCSEMMKNFIPELLPRLQLYSEKRPIFESFNVNKDYQKIFSDTVTLPHGGSLIIEETEALTVIDVNTSRFTGKDRVAETILQTNLEAVVEASTQIRLRNIGGVIVIDFIDMERTKDRVQVLDALEATLKLDRVKTHIVQLSPSGLVEITRRREGLTLERSMYELCSTCSGSGRLKTAETVSIDIRRRLRALIKAPEQTISILTHPEVAASLLGYQTEFISQLENETSGRFVVRVDETMHRESVLIDSFAPDAPFDENVIERCTIGTHDQLYPPHAPEYAVWQNLLVKLPNIFPISEGASHANEIVVLEIIHIGRWFATARIVRGLTNPQN